MKLTTQNTLNHPHVQGRFLLRLRHVYRNYISNFYITPLIKSAIVLMVNLFAKIKKIKFPEKYPWDWKLEMLLFKFEPETVRLCREIIKPGMTVIDIGAHIGYFTRIFSDLVGPGGKVIAFEPVPENYRLLRENTATRSNCTLVAGAVGASDGAMDFYKVRGRSGCHSLIKPNELHEVIPVKVFSLDSFLKKENLNHVDVIKIDVEGAEPLIFDGAHEYLRCAEKITVIMEFNEDFFKNRSSDPMGFFSMIENLGFKIFFFTPNNILQLFDKGEWEKITYTNEEYINLVCRKGI